MGPPPSVNKSLLFTASSRRPAGIPKSRETPQSQAPRFFNTHAGNASKEALFGKSAVGGNGLESSVASFGKSAQKSVGNGSILKSSPPRMFQSQRALGGAANGTRAQAHFGSDVDRLHAEEDSLANISPGAGYGFLARTTAAGELPDLMGDSVGSQDIRQMSPLSASGKKRARSDFDSIPFTKTNAGTHAKGYAATHPLDELTDSDEMVVETESVLEQLKGDESGRGLDAETRAGIVAGELLREWMHLAQADKDGSVGLGLVLGALFLPLYQSGGRWESLSLGKPTEVQAANIPLPAALIGWLAKFHAGGLDILDEVLEHDEGYALADAFWDAISWSACTGRLDLVLKLLRGADFSGHYSKYSSAQLDYIGQGLDCVVEMLETSPALSDGDWDIRGSAWAIHRLQIEKTKAELLQLRVGSASMEEPDDDDFEESVGSSRPALPKPIYDSLVDLCDILLGKKVPILAAANDWIEAVVSLTIWWDGEETLVDDYDYFLNASFSASARNSKRGRPPRHQTRPVDITPNLAYRQRIAQVFQLVLSEEQFAAKGESTQVDFSDPVEIGIACLFEGDMDGVLRLILTDSICITAAILRIASAGGWLANTMSKPKALLDLTKNDLLVLSYGGDEAGRSRGDALQRDQLIARYAMMLSSHKVFESEGFQVDDGKQTFQSELYLFSQAVRQFLGGNWLW
jgi:hypothetical protein